MVFNYELLVSGDVSGIDGPKELAEKGINIAANKRCIYVGKGWKFVSRKTEGKFTCERYTKDGLALESVIPVHKMDCCAHSFFTG